MNGLFFGPRKCLSLDRLASTGSHRPGTATWLCAGLIIYLAASVKLVAGATLDSFAVRYYLLFTVGDVGSSPSALLGRFLPKLEAAPRRAAFFWINFFNEIIDMMS